MPPQRAIGRTETLKEILKLRRYGFEAINQLAEVQRERPNGYDTWSEQAGTKLVNGGGG